MKKFRMPPALIIVMIFLFIVGIMTWFIPTSVVVTNDAGESEIIYNAAFDADGNVIENAGTDPVGLWDLFLAPVQGFANAADVAMAILVSGGLLAILNKSGSLDAGISVLIKRFKGNTLIAILMIVFALMGTVYGAWEELPAYAIIIIPLFVKAGYDVMTGIQVILIGAVCGNMADVVNPYAIGAAVAAIGNDELSLGSGILLRLVLLVVLLAFGIFSVTRYANTVKRDPSKSCLAGVEGVHTQISSEDSGSLSEEDTGMTGRQKASLVAFGIVILACVLGYVPWDSIPVGSQTMFEYVNIIQTKIGGTFLGNFVGTDNFTPFGWWYFNEFSVTWLIGAIIIGIINRMDLHTWVGTFIEGCKDLMGVVMVLAASRGIAIFMGSRESGMSIPFIHWIQSFLSGVPLWAFVIAGVLVYICIALFLQSTSGVSGITMPIFGALAFALFAGSAAGSVGGQVLLMSTFTCGINFVCSWYPEATNMGIIEMAGVPYNIFVKQQLKISLPLIIIATVVISAAPYIGLV